MDDHWFQDHAKKITPRPCIKVGTIEYEEKNVVYEIGYVYIPADKNDDRVYSINKNYPDEGTVFKKVKESGTFNGTWALASTAYIRNGSTTNYLTEEERRRIYEADSMNKNNKFFNKLALYDSSKTKLDNHILKMIVLVGSWDENNKKDKELISELVGLPYDEIFIYLSQSVSEGNGFLNFKNNKWIVNNRLELLNKMSSFYSKENIKTFQNKAINALSNYNPKFDLAPEERLIGNFGDDKTSYSEILKHSVSEVLPMIASIADKFKFCKEEVKNLTYNVIDKILSSTNWKLWATLENCLPLFAEAEPSLFLKKIADKILSEPNMMKELMTTSKRFITTTYYTDGLYNSFRLIAWQENHLVSVCVILTNLFNYDNKAIDVIARILLPWYPQTMANLEVREAAIKNVLKENKEVGWQLLMKLMPKKITSTTPSPKPKWNNIIPEIDEDVLVSDYWIQIENYIKLALETANNDVNKLSQLIYILDDVHKDLFGKIVNHMSQKSILNLSDEEKYPLWDKIEDFINKHLRFYDEEWSLPKDLLDKLKEMSDLLKPKSLLVFNRRFFKRDFWKLQDNNLDYDEYLKALDEKRINILKTIYEHGIDYVIKFVEEVEDPYAVGFCLGSIQISKADDKNIFSFLDSSNENFCLFAKGFTYKKYCELGDDWLNGFDIEKWNINKKINLLITLPKNDSTWEKACNYLGEKEDYYWKKVDIHVIEKGSDINYPLEKLLGVERANIAINIIGQAILTETNYDIKYAIKALNDMLNMQENINSVNTFYIQEIIKDLQKSNISRDELFKIEWSYLSIMDDSNCRPITIEKELSNNPKTYVELLKLAYKPMKAINEKYEFDKRASNAYRVLHKWKTPPGLNENNQIDKVKLENWYNEMRNLSEKEDRLEVGLTNFGRVLFYSPKDNNGLWIDKNVAEILNDPYAENVRKGFSVENYNSIGVVTIDSKGTVYEEKAKEFEEKAKNIEMAGYNRIANVMRKLANNCRREIERIKERY